MLVNNIILFCVWINFSFIVIRREQYNNIMDDPCRHVLLTVVAVVYAVFLLVCYFMFT